MTRRAGRITQKLGRHIPSAEHRMSTPLQAIERLSGWFRNAVAPLWARTAWDGTRGGFFEALDFDGNPIRGHRRVRVQSRQVYTFSMMALGGWRDDAEPIAAAGFEYLINRACPDDGERGCVHALSDEGAVIDDRRDLYDQAFLLLACAGRLRVANCDRATALAKKTLAFLDRELTSPYGGWVESDKSELPRRQNPHMHLFEAFIALHRETGEAIWREKADIVVDLFDRAFFDDASATLGEFFSEDLKSRDAERGAAIEPGHMMEWVWLFGLYEAMTGVDRRNVMNKLYGAAKRHARVGDGFLPDAIGVQNASGKRRLWPQTEYIKAAFTLSAGPGDAFAKDGAAMINAAFGSYFEQPVPGLWCDQYDSAGAPIAGDVPASILYHIFEAIAETQRYAQKIRQS